MNKRPCLFLALGLPALAQAGVEMNISSCTDAGQTLSIDYKNGTPDVWDMRGFGMSIMGAAPGPIRGKFSTSAGTLVAPGRSPTVDYAGCGGFRGVPEHRQLEAKIGTCNEPDPPKEPQALQCAAINTGGAFYGPSVCLQDGLGINRGDGYGGFIDSYQDQTQIQVAVPAGAFALGGQSVRFDPQASMGGPFYMMAMVALQEYLYVDMQFLMAMGASLSGAGLVGPGGATLYKSPDNDGLDTSPYGSFAVTYQTAVGRLMKDYPKYFSTNNINTLVSTGGSGVTQADSPQQLNSGFLAAMNLWWLFDGLKSAQDLCFKQFLKEAADKAAGLKLMLGGYHIGPNAIDNGTGATDYATHVLPTVNPAILGAADVTPNMKRFPWGNGTPPSPNYNTHNYITDVFTVLNQLVNANKASQACGGGLAVYDAALTLPQVKELFFGQGGAPTQPGKGGLLHHFNIDAASRAALWSDLDCAFNALQGKAPGRAAGEISYRYDFLTVLRVARKYFPGYVNKFDDRPTPSDIYSSDWSIWVNNHSRKPCTRSTQDTQWPALTLAGISLDRGVRVEASATDNIGIKAREFTVDAQWRQWTATAATFAVPADMQPGQRLWYRVTDSCGNSTVEEVLWKDKVAMPTANPPGGPFIRAVSVALSTVTPGAAILYTLDGSTPDTVAGGSTLLYAGALTFDQTTVLKARAVKAGLPPSDVMTEIYARAPKAATPRADPPGRQFSSVTTLSVTLASATPGAAILYTLDGTTPDTVARGSTRLYAGALAVSETATLKAVAVKAGMEPSDVMTENYTRVNRVAKPVAMPPGQPFSALSAGLSVTLATSTAGAAILYTLDGTDPDTVAGGSTLAYTGAIPVTATTTLKARAVKAELEPSDIMAEVYTEFEPGKVAAPVAAPPGRNFFQSVSVTLKTATDSASILYTVDGSIPDSVARGATRPYTGALTFTANTTLKARAVKAGMYGSDVMTEIYVSVPPVTVSKAWYQDLDGDGRIETVTLDFSADLAGLPDRLVFWITDETGASKEMAVPKAAIRGAPGLKARAVATLAEPFPFGMTSVINRDVSGRIFRQDGIPTLDGNFPVDDSVAPTITKAVVAEPDSLQPLQRIALTFSESVAFPLASRKALTFKRGNREFPAAEIRIDRIERTDARHYLVYVDSLSPSLPIVGDSAAVTDNGELRDARGNAPARKLFRVLEGILPKPRPVDVFVTFPNGLRDRASTGTETGTPEGILFIPVDRDGAGLPGNEPGKCPGCPAMENNTMVGPVFHFITPGALDYEFRIFSSLGDFLAEGKGGIGEEDLARLQRVDAGRRYDLRIVWTGRTAKGVKAGTGAYILVATLKTARDPRTGAPPGAQTRKVVFGMLRSFRGS